MKKILFLFILLSTYIYAINTYTVTIPPQKFFLQNIGQSKIKVKTIYENIDYSKAIPHSHFRRFSSSSVYFTIGLEVEKKYIKNIKDFNEDLKVIDSSKNVEKLEYLNKYNPYIWLDPLRVREVAKVMLDVLIENDPSNKEYFESNYNTFINELDKIFLRIKNTLFYSQSATYVFDEKWDYFFDRFGLRFFRVENKILSGSDFTKVNRQSKEHNINNILVDKNIEYEIYSSYANANDINIIQVDIFSYDWLSDLFVLSEKLSK